MNDLEPLVLEIIARTDKLERAMHGARAQFTTESDKMQRASSAMRRQLESDSGSVAKGFKAMAGSLAGYFSGREIVNLTNSFTQFQNSLRVAGVASSDLGAVQERLFATAQKYGVEIGTLGSLFGTLTNASKELGASQQQIFQLTDVVSASLKVSGQSATEASGALLQLGQALRGGKVQAEEYNSLLDGMFPLLEAAAEGSDRWGGSVAKLTKDVKDGKVASTELFNAILNGSDNVIKKAELSTLSLSSAYTQLTNALTVYVGEAAQSSGAQAALAAAIGKIAENLDVLIPALALVGGAMAIKYAASAGIATLATLRADAALVGLTSRAEVAGYAIGSLARAFAINGAILAVTAAIGAMGAEMATTDSLIKQANTQFDEMRKRLDAAAAGATTAGDGARGVGDGAASAGPKVRSFAGAVGELANQLYRQAAAAKAARVEMLEKRLSDSQVAEVDLAKRTPAGRNGSANDFRRGDFLNNAGVLVRAATGSLRSALSGGRTDREATDAYKKQSQVSTDLMAMLKAAKEAPLTDFVAQSTSIASPAATGGKGKSGAAGKTADQRQQEQDQIAQQIADAQIGYLQELAQTTQNAADRAELETKVIAATRLANEQDLKNNSALDDASRKKLMEINNQVADLRTQQLRERESDRMRQQQVALTTQALRDEDNLLQLQSGLADTARERHAIELRRLDIAYRIEQAGLAEELKQAEIAGDTDRIAAARKRLADMEEKRSLDTQGVGRANETPGQRYLRSVNKTGAQIDEDLEAITADGLQSLNDGLVDAITGAESLGDAFGNVADQIIKDLLRIAIQQSVIKPLAESLFGSGAGALAGPMPSATIQTGSVVGAYRPWGEVA